MREVTNPQTGGGLVEPPLLHHVLREGNKVWRQPDNQGQQSRRFQHQSRRFGAQIGRKTHWALAKQLNKDSGVSVGPCGDVVPWGSTQMLFSGCKRVSSKCLFPFLFPVANHTKEKQFSSFCYRSPHYFAKENAPYSEFNQLTTFPFFLRTLNQIKSIWAVISGLDSCPLFAPLGQSPLARCTSQGAG